MPDDYRTWIPDDWQKGDNDSVLEKYLSLRLNAEVLTELADAVETIGLLIHTLATALERLEKEIQNHDQEAQTDYECKDCKLVRDITEIIEKITEKYREDKE